MNRTSSQYSKCFSISLLTAAFLISSQMPLLASPQQSSSGQSSSAQTNPQNTVEPKQNDALPESLRAAALDSSPITPRLSQRRFRRRRSNQS